MQLTQLLLTASAILSAVAVDPKAKDFTGLGQIRTLYIERDHNDLGCLTSAGKWTVDEAQCGTFSTEQISDSTFHLSAPEGPCGIDVATFKCGSDVQAAIFGVGSSF
jgi:hypothetical protein